MRNKEKAIVPEKLLTRYLAGRCTPAEEQLIGEWYASFENEAPYFENEHSEEALDLKARTKTAIRLIIANDIQRKPRVRKMMIYSSAAAAFLILITAGLYGWLLQNQTDKNKRLVGNVPAHLDSANITPGANKAMLTLADGTVIDLDHAANGLLATEAGTTVSKQADGRLEYQGAHSPLSTDHSPAYNILSTPKGGQYQIVLPDGSKVWLNAASSIKYPTVFTGNERRVNITGEVYFEIAHDRHKPFIVSKGNTSVQVLGTHFNMNAYDDESALKVTLLEGSVRVGRSEPAVGNRPSFAKASAGEAACKERSVVLKPGEQAIAVANPLTTEHADATGRHPDKRSFVGDSPLTINHSPDLDAVIAWKNGLFQFNNVTIEAVMKQVARWYDVEVVYERDVSQDLFRGKIYRNADIGQLLRILELSGAHFKIEGKKIIVQ